MYVQQLRVVSLCLLLGAQRVCRLLCRDGHHVLQGFVHRCRTWLYQLHTIPYPFSALFLTSINVAKLKDLNCSGCHKVP